jgi:hypothetical protein
MIIRGMRVPLMQPGTGANSAGVESRILAERLRQHFGPKGIVEVAATVAARNMVSRLLVALNDEH